VSDCSTSIGASAKCVVHLPQRIYSCAELWCTLAFAPRAGRELSLLSTLRSFEDEHRAL
jgi:hypothetical protein